jgi:hypothetical protein
LVLLLAEQKKNPAAGPGPGLVVWQDERIAASANASLPSRRVAQALQPLTIAPYREGFKGSPLHFTVAR